MSSVLAFCNLLSEDKGLRLLLVFTFLQTLKQSLFATWDMLLYKFSINRWRRRTKTEFNKRASNVINSLLCQFLFKFTKGGVKNINIRKIVIACTQVIRNNKKLLRTERIDSQLTQLWIETFKHLPYWSTYTKFCRDRNNYWNRWSLLVKQLRYAYNQLYLKTVFVPQDAVHRNSSIMSLPCHLPIQCIHPEKIQAIKLNDIF